LDDVCQEVFVVVHRRLDSFKGRSTLRTWLFGVLANVVRSHRRTLQRKSPAHRGNGPLLDPDDLKDNDASPYEQTRYSEAARVAQSFLDQIDEDKRVVFILAELEGMRVSEVAECLEINVNTTHARLRSARKQFSQLVRRHHLQDDWRSR
jgi:RNA polymerase sigma-70 factor (ECF subfamily)